MPRKRTTGRRATWLQGSFLWPEWNWIIEIHLNFLSNYSSSLRHSWNRTMRFAKANHNPEKHYANRVWTVTVKLWKSRVSRYFALRNTNTKENRHAGCLSITIDANFLIFRSKGSCRPRVRQQMKRSPVRLRGSRCLSLSSFASSCHLIL